MIPLNMEFLERKFRAAAEAGHNYVAIKVKMAKFPYDEVIINPIGNMEAKLNYYKNTYTEDLEHKFSEGIRIVGVAFGDTFEDIEKYFYKGN